MSGPSVVLDACVLVPIRLATSLLWLAERGLFHPLWSEQILDEVERNLPKLGIQAGKAARRVGLMRDSFGSEALINGFDHLVDQMTCDAKDRHVLAAAVHGEADAIATFNLRDFPDDSVIPYGIRVVSPEDLLIELLAARPGEVISTLREEVRAFGRPPETLDEFLATLTPTVPTFANLASDVASDPDVAGNEIPALEQTSEERARAAFGEPEDWTNPAQVALVWWESLIASDLRVTRALTWHPPAFGTYECAVAEVSGRSLASKVLPAVDAPDTIAFMRFVPKVAASAQVFSAYVTSMTFLTLIKLDDDSWRVWGLGPRMPAARDILADPVR